MQAKIQLYVWMAVLVALGLGLAAYKHWQLGFPIIPGKTQTVWTVEAKVQFKARGEPAKVSLNLPEDTENLVVIESGSASPGYGYQRLDQGESEARGVWSTREARGPQAVYYRAQVYRGDGKPFVQEGEKPGKPEKPRFHEPKATAADTVLASAFFHSADAVTLAAGLIKLLDGSNPDDNVRALLHGVEGESARNQLLLDLLASANVPARPLRGITLGENTKRQALLELIEVFDGEAWVAIDPKGGGISIPETFLPWQRGDQSLLDVYGGQDSRVIFSVITDERAARNVATYLGREQNAGLVDFSIFSLPVDVQKTFSMLLLIPIGALVVVILRNLVGLQTSGTFMPILIALAFVQTTLLVGIVLFLTVVGTGLLIRGYLSRLNLLLVPRIAAVLIVVIGLYIGLSVMGFKMGLTAALSITFFPMIIISWTIERMSILWEEEGAKEVMIQGGGSLLTASIAYLVMTERHIAYLFFAFPELLLVVLAIILSIGQYTGYRLSELRRFEPLSKEG
ncbi:MAG: inactive transglutaminase family protein [Gammaproteobacteria bacterium]|nr:inactive transglutaminase family protein [Gammaproteobacteria bacterium]